jgi:DNA-binding NtrC family response regulator
LHKNAQVQDVSKLKDDFRYRLQERVVETKPLAVRPEDVVVLLNDSIEEVCSENGQFIPDIKAKWLLYNYNFPGNVRELRNLVKNLNDYDYIKRWTNQASRVNKHLDLLVIAYE